MVAIDSAETTILPRGDRLSALEVAMIRGVRVWLRKTSIYVNKRVTSMRTTYAYVSPCRFALAKCMP
jgi:hypothetical protein